VGRIESERLDRFALRFSFNDFVAFFLLPERCGDLEGMMCSLVGDANAVALARHHYPVEASAKVELALAIRDCWAETPMFIRS
jgi:hypothetical protein